MADTIKGAGDIYEKDLYGDLAKSAENVIPLLETINNALKETAKSNTKVLNVEAKDIKTLNELNKGINEINESYEQKIKIDKQRISVENTLKNLDTINAEQLGEITDKVTRLSAARNVLLKKTRDAAKLVQQGNELSRKSAGLTRAEEIELGELSKQLFVARKEKVAINKANRDILKTSADVTKIEGKEINTLDKLSTSNRLLRKERKFLNLETEEGQKRVKEINKQLDSNTAKIKENLDAFGKNKVEIGGYKDAIKEALEETEGFAGGLGGTVEAADELVPGLGKAAGGVSTLKDSFKALLANPILLLIGAIVGAVVALGKAFAGTERGAFEFEKASAKLGSTFDVLSGKLAKFSEDLLDGKLFDGITERFNNFAEAYKDGGIFNAITNDLTKSAEEGVKFRKELDEAAKGAENIVILENAFHEVNRELEITLTNLSTVAETQSLIASDATKSFKVREAAASSARKASEEAAEIEFKLAKARDFIAQKEFEQQKRVNQLSAEDIQARTDAQVNLIEAQKNLLVVQIQNQQEIDQLREDRLTDYIENLEQGFDNQRAINEKIIGNEAVALLKREELLRKTSQLSQELYLEQIESIEEFTKIKIDQDDLLIESDTVVLKEKIRALGLSEALEGQLLNSIINRKDAIQDLEDVEANLFDFRLKQQEALEKIELNLLGDDFEKEVAKTLKASEKLIEEIDKLREDNIISQEEAGKLREEETERVENKINQLEIKAGKKRIKDAADISKAEFEVQRGGFKTQEAFEKEKAAQFLAIKRNSLNDELALLEKFGGQESEVRKKQIKAELENLGDVNKEVLKSNNDLQKALLDKVEESIAKRSEKRVEELEGQVEKSEENQNRLRELADKGSLQAEQSIAAETKKQAELKKAQEKEERKQELVTAGFKIFSALLDQGKDPSAATIETATLLGALPAIIDAIPAFFEGTESTGKVSNALDSNGGRLALLHDDERVMTKKQNSKMGGISNEDAANVIQRYNMGELYEHNNSGLNAGFLDSVNLNLGLQKQMKELNESVKAIKIPETTVTADELRNLLIIKKKVGNIVETQKSKLH